jgi:glutaredoxin 3
MAKVEIFSSVFCPYCHRAKKVLDGKRVAYEEIDLMVDPSRREEMVRRAGGRTKVPQIFIDGRHVGGLDELVALEREGTLDRLLEAS